MVIKLLVIRDLGWIYPLFQILYGFDSGLETRQILTLRWEHHLDQDQNLVFMFPYSLESPIGIILYRTNQNTYLNSNFLKYLKDIDLCPFNTSTYSWRSLKGTGFSKATLPPGALDKKNPKSIWRIAPVFLLIRIFSLCLSLIYKI